MNNNFSKKVPKRAKGGYIAQLRMRDSGEKERRMYLLQEGRRRHAVRVRRALELLEKYERKYGNDFDLGSDGLNIAELDEDSWLCLLTGNE